MMFYGIPACDNISVTLFARQANEEINWEIYWNPKLSVENAFGEPKENVWYSVSFDAHGQATVTERRRVNGSFLEYMELYQFPFDTQVGLTMCHVQP
jgi:hypothetical protein